MHINMLFVNRLIAKYFYKNRKNYPEPERIIKKI